MCFRFDIREEADGTETLEIKDLKMQDQGEYKCVIGDRETVATLTVEEGLITSYII